MATRFHYDDIIYQKWLAERLPTKEQEVVSAHLESCENCQEKLESISSADVSWNDIQSYLRSDLESSSRGASVAVVPNIDLAVGSSAREVREQEFVVSFLEPSNESDSLGRFGRYEIVEVLGRGGMGVVMRGFDPSLDRYSAIKVLAPELATNAAARQRFFREAKSAAAVIHDHVIPIQTVDEWAGLPYLLMPVIEGKSLQQRVAQHQGSLTLPEILRIGSQVAAGLSAAHAQGLVHRDVKPANILLENGIERVLISDFGLARAADDANVTRSQVISGTPQYMSPEQARGTEIDSRADLFSLGSVLYFMCCGHSPFRASTTMGVLHRIVTDDPRPIRSLNPEIPEWLQSIVERLLEKNPGDRFQTADEVSVLLQRWLAHVQQPGTIAPPEEIKSTKLCKAEGRSTGWPPITKWLVALAAFGFFAVALTIIVLETNKGTITIQSASDDTKIRIKRGEHVVKELTVTNGEASTRIASGEYVIEIDGRSDEFSVENGAVELKRGGKWFAKVVESAERKVEGRETGDSSVGEEVITIVAASDDGSVNGRELLNSGITAFQAEDFDKAISNLNEVYEANPKDEKLAPTALLYLWTSYRSKDDLVKSIEIQDRLIHDFPHSQLLPSTKYFRSLNLYHLGKVDEARDGFDEVITNFPKSKEAQYSKSLQKHADWQEQLQSESVSEKERDELVKGMQDNILDSMEIDKLASIAGWEFGQHRWDEAERLFKKVLERETDGPWASDALIHMANCRIGKEDDEAAIGYLNEWFKRFPDQSGMSMNLFQLGDCQARLGRKAEAKATWKQLLEKYPNSVFAKQATAGLEKLND